MQIKQAKNKFFSHLKPFLMSALCVLFLASCNEEQTYNCRVIYGIDPSRVQSSQSEAVNICFDNGFENDPCKIYFKEKLVFDNIVKSNPQMGCAHSFDFKKEKQASKLRFEFGTLSCDVDVINEANSIKISKNKKRSEIEISVTNLLVLNQ